MLIKNFDSTLRLSVKKMICSKFLREVVSEKLNFNLLSFGFQNYLVKKTKYNFSCRWVFLFVCFNV